MLSACSKTESPSFEDRLYANKSIKQVITDPKHEVQIIFTEINRDPLGKPAFNSHTFQLDSNKYFYPASTVKMPIAILALEKLNELAISGLDKHTTMLTDSAFSGQTAVLTDSTSENGLPSIAHYIKKLFIVSDNDAYNRLYEFLGQDYINEKLRAKGYIKTRITHRLSIPLTKEENLANNPIRFIKNDSVIYTEPLRHDLGVSTDINITKGKGYIKNDSLVLEPFDFSYKNFFPLHEQHRMLKAIFFPESLPVSSQFKLSEDDYKFLKECMSTLPGDSEYPRYDRKEYYDASVKFLIFGNNKDPIPDHIKIYNKIGQAYGYMTDNAYIVNLNTGEEFMLTATLHVNANEIYNDGVYEYDSIGYRFMRELGRLLIATD
ncbi:MAG: serine hydrolase [Fulvivirga sp.]